MAGTTVEAIFKIINMPTKENNRNLAPWKHYVTITLESLLSFYLGTFCLAMYFTHQGKDLLLYAIFMTLLYLFVIFVCAKRIIATLPIATIMLMVPLTPLIALIIVISLIPVLQLF